MNRFIQIIPTALVVIAIMKFSVFADGDHEDRDGHFHPDSLELITVTGVAMVDSLMMYPIYYLDENGDDKADYYLNFGPSWYKPDSSLASLPDDQEEVTIYGGLYVSHEDSFKIIVVYEINGLFWREPYDALWNNMGGHYDDEGHHIGRGYAFGWMHGVPEVKNVNGTVFVDTTFIHEYYYLDINEDDEPDYFLNFGPPWYEPVSGIERPVHGQVVSITGGEIDQHTIPMLIVYEIDGQVWRDSSAFGPHFGGGWINKDMNESRIFYAPYDTLDRMKIYPGWYNGMGHGQGGMMSDSLFCQILEIFPQNLPQHHEYYFFAGYEIGIFNPAGYNNMQESEHGGRMEFSSEVDFMLHYDDIQIQGFNMDESTIKVKYWDNQANTWQTISDAVIDPINNTVSFYSSNVGTFFALDGRNEVTKIVEVKNAIPEEFLLKQNYPNPFNPITTIEFSLNKDAVVNLSIYNVLGQKIVELLNRQVAAGSYKVKFDAHTLPSGTYFYQLKVGKQSSIKRMNILK